MPRIVSHHQKLGRGQQKFSPRTFGESLLLLTPWLGSLGFRDVREYISVLLNHSRFWSLVRAALVSSTLREKGILPKGIDRASVGKSPFYCLVRERALHNSFDFISMITCKADTKN